MAYFRVILVFMDGVYEKKTLLDNRFQIVFMSRDTAIASKITWDMSLSIQMQSANGSLLQMCRLVKNMPFILKEVTILLQI